MIDESQVSDQPELEPLVRKWCPLFQGERKGVNVHLIKTMCMCGMLLLGSDVMAGEFEDSVRAIVQPEIKAAIDANDAKWQKRWDAREVEWKKAWDANERRWQAKWTDHEHLAKVQLESDAREIASIKAGIAEVRRELRELRRIERESNETSLPMPLRNPTRFEICYPYRPPVTCYPQAALSIHDILISQGFTYCGRYVSN